MKNILRYIGFVLLIFLFISGIMVLYGTPSQKPEQVSLTQLANQINEGQVKKITVNNNELEIEKNDGKTEKATKEKEAGLTESLKNYGVDTQKLQSVNIDVKGESSVGSWAGVILPFLLPFILISVFIWFMLRQAQRGNTQALSFGLSRARMID
ncbi:MAG TPA: ATP-dependent metallopeptidase FtsH/Yme1/Tma family protein, partial [Patescibacteria group bacterium]|nr:ATP-dependent metallopeptidase FtsH/Yme1/Tma family protein [Patescibacteria group bacterium]